MGYTELKNPSDRKKDKEFSLRVCGFTDWDN